MDVMRTACALLVLVRLPTWQLRFGLKIRDCNPFQTDAAAKTELLDAGCIFLTNRPALVWRQPCLILDVPQCGLLGGLRTKGTGIRQIRLYTKSLGAIFSAQKRPVVC